MKSRQLLSAIGVVIASVASFSANATCTRTGEIVRVSNFASSSIMYLRSTSLTNFYYRGTVTDLDLRGAVNDAVVNRNKVQLTGNASSCPTSGSSRNMGTITTVRLHP